MMRNRQLAKTKNESGAILKIANRFPRIRNE